MRKGGRATEVAEVWSPPRVTKVASKLGLEPGHAMDLTNGCGFRLERHREAALRYIRTAKPKLVIGSPECTLLSPLQKLNQTPREK